MSENNASKPGEPKQSSVLRIILTGVGIVCAAALGVWGEDLGKILSEWTQSAIAKDPPPKFVKESKIKARAEMWSKLKEVQTSFIELISISLWLETQTASYIWVDSSLTNFLKTAEATNAKLDLILKQPQKFVVIWESDPTSLLVEIRKIRGEVKLMSNSIIYRSFALKAPGEHAEEIRHQDCLKQFFKSLNQQLLEAEHLVEHYIISFYSHDSSSSN